MSYFLFEYAQKTEKFTSNKTNKKNLYFMLRGKILRSQYSKLQNM